MDNRRSRNNSDASSKPIPGTETSVAATGHRDSNSIVTTTGQGEITAVTAETMDMIYSQLSVPGIMQRCLHNYFNSHNDFCIVT